MRIVITKDGKTIIQEIDPENKYKSLLERKPLKKRSCSNASYNTSNLNFTNNNNNSFGKYHHQNSKSYYDLDTIFTNLQTQENRNDINLKEINVNSKNKLFLPNAMQEKYNNYKDYKTISIKEKNENKESKGNNLMPEVYVSINKEIEKDLEEKGYDYVCKNFRTLNNMRMEEEELEKSKKINNLFTKKNSETEDKNQNGNGNSDKSKTDRTNNSLSSHLLPNILPAYPLKYIINRNSLNHVLKKASQDEDNIKRGEKLNEYNFRSKIKINPRSVMEESLKKEIDTKNNDLIEYLNKSYKINGDFLKRISNYRNNRIFKLNKISQKAIFNKNLETTINNGIKNKIKIGYMHTSEEYKKGLDLMKDRLEKYENLMKFDNVKRFNNKNNYRRLHLEKEKYWIKYNILRFNKRGNMNLKRSTTNDF
jgi:hypothetical protein